MKTLLATAGFVLASSAAFAQSSPQDFVRMANSGGLYEIQSSQMVLDGEATDPEVQEFANQMIEDHTKAANELAAAAEKSGVTVPAEPASMEATKLKQLSQADGKQGLYLTQQRLAHNNAVLLHRAYAASGTDANLKAYAEKVLPVLEEHSSHIDMLQAEKM